MKGKPEIQQYDLICQRGDTFIACTDGASLLIDESEIDLSGVLDQENPSEILVSQAVNYNIRANGKSDNTTVIIAEVL
jgi:hypothetical protein